MTQTLESINHKIETCNTEINNYQSLVEKYKKDKIASLVTYFKKRKGEYLIKRRGYENEKKLLLRRG